MKEIYRHINHAKVGLLESIFKSAGIPVFVKNVNLTVSGLTEIPIREFYPALCILNDEDEELALELMKEFLADEDRPEGEDWLCSGCGESVPDSFTECWSCQQAR